MDNFIFSAEEEKAMVGILYNHLVFGTTMEVAGELNKEGVNRLENLRSLLGKLLRKYSLSDALGSEAYLTLGLADFISKDKLIEFSKDEKNKHLQNRANYLLKKYDKQ